MKAQQLFGLQVLQDQPLLQKDVLRVADTDGWFWIKKIGLDEEYDWQPPIIRSPMVIRMYQCWCNKFALGSDRDSIEKIEAELAKECKEDKDGEEEQESTAAGECIY